MLLEQPANRKRAHEQPTWQLPSPCRGLRGRSTCLRGCQPGSSTAVLGQLYFPVVSAWLTRLTPWVCSKPRSEAPSPPKNASGLPPSAAHTPFAQALLSSACSSARSAASRGASSSLMTGRPKQRGVCVCVCMCVCACACVCVCVFCVGRSRQPCQGKAGNLMERKQGRRRT